MFQITHPLILLALTVIPVLLIIHRTTKVEAARWRRWTTLVLRVATLSCLIFALAGLYRKHREDVLAVVFLLDVSDSIPMSQQQTAMERMDAAVAQLKSADSACLIHFAGEALIRLPMRPKTEWAGGQGVSTEAERGTTDIANAIQLAMRIVPDDQQRRIVLLSDGLQNRGELDQLLGLVQASGIEIFTIPLNAERENEVWIRNLRVPTQVRSGQTFPIRAVVESTKATQITAHLYRDNILIHEAKSINLKPGIQEISDFPPQRLDAERNYRYQLKISSDDDPIPDNNTAYGFVRVQGQLRVLYVEGDTASPEKQNENQTVGAGLPSPSRAGLPSPYESILKANRFVIKVIPPDEFPTDLVTLQTNDVLILENVSADLLSTQQMNLIENYVRDLGKGLVVIGGDRAFGRGGYHDTPLERTLPLDMTPRQRKESLAMMFVVDTSGSMANYVGPDQKIQLAFEGIRAGIRELDDEDLAGVIGFAAALKEFPLTTDRDAIYNWLSKLYPSGGTKMYNSLERAYKRLEAVDVKQKHIVLLSDGRASDASNSDFMSLARQIAGDKVMITTLAIGDAAQKLMQDIAVEGNGEYVPVQNLNQLPKILAEAVRQTQKYTIQEPFQPVINATGHQILAGINSLPKLYGYIATSEKEFASIHIRSHEDHPILAAWNYGLGRSVAFTSDAKPRWAKDWMAWENFGKFWGQVVNWVTPAANHNATFDLNVSHSNGVGTVTIETALSGKGFPSHKEFPSHGGRLSEKFDVRVVYPNTEGKAIEIEQVMPTRYEGDFPISEHGAYLVTAQRKTEGQNQNNGDIIGSQTASLVVSYPAEFATFETNHRLLKDIARRTNGIYDPSPRQIVKHTGNAVERQQLLSHLLLAATIFLFALELIIRRLSIASGYLTELRATLIGKRISRPQGETASPTTLTRLTQRKASLAQARRPPESTAPQQSVATQPQIQGGHMERLLAAKRGASGKGFPSHTD